MLKFLKYSLLILISVVLIFVLSNLFYFNSFRLIYSNGIKAKNLLNSAVTSATDNNFAAAVLNANEADADLKIALTGLDKISQSFLYKHVAILNDQLSEVKYLLSTADILSRSLSQGGAVAQKLNDAVSGKGGVGFFDMSSEQKKVVLQLIYESLPELNGVKANLDLALLNLNKVSGNGVLTPFKGQIVVARDQLQTGVAVASKAIIAAQILPGLIGYPSPSNYLVLLQNNSELRPTGGFLGTVGNFEISLGDIAKFKTDDSYHLDMPASLDKNFKVTPPWQLQKYLNVDRWYMRDANWSPDWPESAQKIEWFYRAEAKYNNDQEIKNVPAKFTGIVAITPSLVTDLLALVGPVSAGGKEYNKDNFVDLLQAEVEINYVAKGVSQWDRKKVIADILSELKKRLFNLPKDRYSDLFNIVTDNVKRKNILVYFNDAQLNTLSSGLGWGGEIKNTPADYLMVVDANLAAYKTDRVMDKTINYTVTEKADGLYASLKLDYDHNGSFDWKTTTYRNYVRVYVPSGAKLISSSGFAANAIESQDETFTFANAKKTYFGGFLSVEPGHSASLSLEYKLPDYIKDYMAKGTYDLYVQKQPGNKTKVLNVNMELNKKSASYTNTLTSDAKFNLQF
ncbi:MAG: DUF4012 domain-containing protein [Candidatus Falkowbacteria bacterium]